MAESIVASYDYRDEQGVLLYQNVRFEPKDFRQRRPDGNDGWVWNLDGTPRLLYRLPELLAASSQDWVLIVEGEKDTDNLRDLGFVATTSGNASSWRAEFAPHFAGRLVCILPDKDKAGRRYAEIVRDSLQGVAAEARLAEVPGEHKDISDYIEARDAADEQTLRIEIQGMIDAGKPAKSARIGDNDPGAKLDQKKPGKRQSNREEQTELDTRPVHRPRILDLESLTPRTVDWLWQNMIPMGGFTSLGANPGAGKTSVMLDSATRLSLGRPMPLAGRDSAKIGTTVFVGQEDSAERVLLPRLKNMGADLSKVKILAGVDVVRGNQVDDEPFSLDGMLHVLDSLMATYPDTRLIVLDPITDYLGAAVNPNSNQEVRRVLQPLNPWADGHNVAVVGITHLNKRKDDDAIYRTLGSMGFAAVARAVLGISIHPEDADKPAWERRRILTAIKESYAPEGDSLVFRIDQSLQTLLWESEPLRIGANELLSGNCASVRTTKAEAWLKTQLESAQGPVDSQTLKKRAVEYGVCSERSLTRAATKLRVARATTGVGASLVSWWGKPGMDIDGWLQSSGRGTVTQVDQS